MVNKLHPSNNLVDRIQAYLLNHVQVFFFSLGRLIRSPLTTIMTVLVLAITVSLAASFHLLVNNAQQISGNLESSNQLSLFLKAAVSDAAGQQLADKLSRNILVEQIKVITKQQAMDEFKAYSGFGDALNALKNNPLPTVIQVLPANTLNGDDSVKKLIGKLKKLPQVDFVQIDKQWIERLQAFMQLIRRGVTALNLLLAIAVIFITGNTIRLELQNRRDEVLIAKLVGATNSFVQRPFLYAGFWLGFFAGLTAWFITTLLMWAIQTPVEKLSQLYHGSFHLQFLDFSETLLLITSTSFLGIAGALSVLFFQLQQIKPQ